MDRYGSDAQCRALLENLRWPNGIACPRCGSLAISGVKTRPVYDCNDCQYQFSVTAGTIMHDSHLPLRKWFVAIYLMCESKKGVSSLQLKRTLGVAYKTAWHLTHRIREAMANDPLEGPTLFGVIEVDETYVGGKTTGKGRGYRGNKTIVAGAIQRDGNVRMERIPDVRRTTLHGFISRTVKDEAEAIYTDESYLGIEDDDTRHETVNHGAMGRGRRAHELHRGRVVAVQALHRRELPQGQLQAHRPLPLRAGVALQQPQQRAHLPRRAPARADRQAHLPGTGRLGRRSHRSGKPMYPGCRMPTRPSTIKP